jgi:hypothetical protein
MAGDWPADPVFTLINAPLRYRAPEATFAPSTHIFARHLSTFSKDWTPLFLFRRQSLNKFQKKLDAGIENEGCANAYTHSQSGMPSR